MRRMVILTESLAVSALLIAAACGSARAPTERRALHGIELRSSASLVRDSATGNLIVNAVLTATNVADTTTRIEWAECPSNGPLVVYVYLVGSSKPVWNATDGYRRVACFLVAYYAYLSPGQTWQHATTIPVRDILGDSLPAGAYRLTGTANWLTPGFPDEMSLGQLQLSIR